MKEFITKRGIYIAVLAVVIAIFAAVSVALSSGGAGFASTLSEPVFKPLRTAIGSMLDSLEGLYDYMYKFDQISAENEALRSRIAILEEEYREYTEISEENERLRALLGFDARHSDDNLEYCSVSVTGWTASNFSSSFTINKGSSSGIELFDCVITKDGLLVGQVTEVTSASATVVTILDTTMSFGALVYSTGATGIIEGSFDLFSDGLIKFGYLSDDANVIIGDTVVTSGQGGTCPSGLVIGHVDSIAENPSGLDYHAVVTPAANIESSANLYVITNFTPEE